ncbi:hypothetical protein [Campylobacter molothri]
MKILKIAIVISTLFFLGCATTNKEIPKKSPCACENCIYDVIKIN